MGRGTWDLVRLRYTEASRDGIEYKDHFVTKLLGRWTTSLLDKIDSRHLHLYHFMLGAYALKFSVRCKMQHCCICNNVAFYSAH